MVAKHAHRALGTQPERCHVSTDIARMVKTLCLSLWCFHFRKAPTARNYIMNLSRLSLDMDRHESRMISNLLGVAGLYCQKPVST